MSDKIKMVFLDIETTGLDPRRHEILEIAMIKRTQRWPGADISLQFSLNVDLTRADEKALEVNRYDERAAELAEIQVSDSVAAQLLLSTLREAVVIGNNVQFDLRFIEQFLRECGEDPTPWHYHPVDIKALAAGRLSMGPPPWSTKDIAQDAGVPLPADAHSAWADAAWNRDVYDSVLYPQTRLPNGSVNPPRLHGPVREAMELGGSV